MLAVTSFRTRGFSLRCLLTWFGLGPRPEAQPEVPPFRPRPLPGQSQAIDRSAVLARGDELMRRYRASGLPVTVLVFELHDLPELECVFGAAAARSAMARAAAKWQRIAGASGLVLRPSPTALAVLLPDRQREETLDLMRLGFGQPCSLEIETGGEEIVLIPEYAMRVVRTENDTLAQVTESLRREIEAARTFEQQRRDWLQQERESHSKPMELPDPVQELLPVQRPAVRSEHYPRIPATMPAPLLR